MIPETTQSWKIHKYVEIKPHATEQQMGQKKSKEKLGCVGGSVG